MKTQCQQNLRLPCQSPHSSIESLWPFDPGLYKSSLDMNQIHHHQLNILLFCWDLGSRNRMNLIGKVDTAHVEERGHYQSCRKRAY